MNNGYTFSCNVFAYIFGMSLYTTKKAQVSSMCKKD